PEAISALQNIVGKASKGYGVNKWSLEATLNSTKVQKMHSDEHPDMEGVLK
ncbi:hypothetical protein A2U01_0059942, partial [Trifolium medium]|nr:hypothetical protein [Trifolium medium]